MSQDTLSYLKSRGFFQQCTDEETLRKMFAEKKVHLYAGFDPTNNSLHLGHLIPIMAMAHLQKRGHFPIALIGGGTALIGDPTGKVESRKILTLEQIQNNSASLKLQLEKFVVLDGKDGLLVNNYDWLKEINYLTFLRDIGRHFSVNRMLSFETYKERMKHGLSFLEFNYLLLQSYDFLELYKRYNCTLQVGGDDQWANMVSGAELIRRVEKSEAVECLTFPLILTSDGKKMGKTESGATFLSAELTSPYDFYQYWINVTDDDVIRFLKLYTFLDLDDIKQYEGLKYQELNIAKKRLAFEVTRIVHGEEEAVKAREGASAAFGGGDTIEFMPTTEIVKTRLEAGINIVDLVVECELAASKSEVRRLIAQGGCKINSEKVLDDKLVINLDYLTDKGIIVALGKKKIRRVNI